MKEIQDKIKKFCKEHRLESPTEHNILDAMSELGEVAKEILKTSDYGRKPVKYRKELKSEIGDLFYTIIKIANSFNIDLEDSLNMVLKKYKKRLSKGSAGSESD